MTTSTRSTADPGTASLDLFWTLVRTDFKTRYHGTLGGYAWALLKPLAMFAVLLAVFSFVFTTEPRYRLNLIIGLFLYEFYSESTKAGFVSLLAKGFLLTKVKISSWILVVVSVSNALITLAIFSTILLITLAFAGAGLHPLHVALYLWYLAHYLVMVVGISLAASVLLVRYRDLNQIWDVVIQAGFFFAPIVYPLGVIPERFHLLLYVWPPTPVIQFSRSVLVEGAIPTFKAHALLTLFALSILALGTFVFVRQAPRAAEHL